MKLTQIPFSLPGSPNYHSSFQTPPTVHRAKWIVLDPWTILENGYLEVTAGIITSVGSGKPPGEGLCYDHGPVALMPACVNAHTHLELSALKDRVPLNHGFRTWVKHLIEQRDAHSLDSLRAGALSGIHELVNCGCRLVADISSLGITFSLLKNESMAGILFREFLGHEGHFEFDISEQTEILKTGLAGHAPHTTSPELFKQLKTHALKNNCRMSIHVAESEDEISFITTGQGPWADFLTQRHIDFSKWPVGAGSPVAYLSKIGVLDDTTLAVHLLFTDSEDIDLLCRHRVNVCLCPRSNHGLHHQVPDIERMLSAGIKPCLGTDSLASAPSLSIFDEMSFVASTYPSLSPATILSMGTINGAVALGEGNRFGSLHPGHLGAAVIVPVDGRQKKNLIEEIVYFKQTETEYEEPI